MPSRTKQAQTIKPVLKSMSPVLAPNKDMSKRPRASDTIEGASGAWVKEKIIGDFTSRFTYGYIPTDKLLVDLSYCPQLERRQKQYFYCFPPQEWQLLHS